MNDDPAKPASRQRDAAEPCAGPMAATLSLLAELARLGPGWDGYGADPIGAPCLANVSAVLAALPAGTPGPEIAPNPNGTLTLDWVVGGYSLSFEIGAARYSAIWESAAGVQTDEGHILPDIPVFVTAALAALRQRPWRQL